jgi:hypothetical protein
MADTGIAPRMTNNEALRRLLAIYTNNDGSLKPGAPGGPQPGNKILTTRHEAGGPNPDLAYLLVGTRESRVGGMLRNIGNPDDPDENGTIWYGSTADITEASGATLNVGESVPVNTAGPIYIYKIAGSPFGEFVEVYD